MSQRTSSPCSPLPLLALTCTAAAILLLTSGCHGCGPRKPPHVVFILADDLGWRDVSWNANDTYTPHLDWMRSKGVALDSHYMQPACTASRVALYTGYYPYTMGFQRNDFAQFHRYRNHSLSTDIRILPEYLQQAGYANHLVGKWQMGFCNWRYTPTRRGFETFYGSYGGNSGHFNHTPAVGGYDFRDDLNVDWSAKGQYSTHLYTQRAVDIIQEHHDTDDTRPLFLMLAYEAPHVPVEAPAEYVDKYCDHVENTDNPKDRRRERCGMMAALDEGVRNVTEALEKLGYMDNTLIVFTSDNGAPGQQGGSNWPLRGKKRSAYEGGVRVPSFLYSNKRSKLLPRQPYVYKGLMHVTDWLPTLLSVAGMDPESRLPKRVDGLDQWSSIRRNDQSRRKFMVYDLDTAENYTAVRMDKWKLIQDNSNDKCDGWYNPPPGEESRPRKLSCPEFQLFNLEDDPEERFNLADTQQRIVAKLQKFLKKSSEKAGDLPPVFNATEGFPDRWDGVWSPGWCDTAH